MYIKELNEWKKIFRISILLTFFLFLIYIVSTLFLVIYYNVKCHSSFYVMWFIVPPIFFLLSFSILTIIPMFYIRPEARLNNREYIEKKLICKKYKFSKYFLLSIMNFIFSIVFIAPISIFSLIKGVPEKNQDDFVNNNLGAFKESNKYYNKASSLNLNNYFYSFYSDWLYSFLNREINGDSFNKLIYYLNENDNIKKEFLNDLNNLNYKDISNDNLYSEYSFSIKRTINVLKNINYDIYLDPNLFLFGLLSLGTLLFNSISFTYFLIKKHEAELIDKL